MSLPPLVGHSEARRRLAEGLRGGNLPQVLLLTGPRGIGKQRLALWLGQLVLCERQSLEPCGECRACHLVEGLTHPDLHWFVPIVRPKASEAGKQIEEASEALAAAMADRRRQPLYGPPDGMAIHPIASVRLLLQQAGLSAVESSWRVFIIGEADRLVPQEASQEAANAMLKLLEEPPQRSLFVLTTVDPRALLPTIRSRTAPVRLNRLSDADVREFLEGQRSAKSGAADVDAKVSAAGGSIGAAIAGEGDDSSQAYRAATDLLEAVLAGRGPFLERALKQPPYAARGEFTAMLDALADTLGEAARAALGQPTRRPVPGGAHEAARCHRPAPRHGARKPGSRGGVGQRESAAPARGLGWRAGGGPVKLSHLDQSGRARMVDVGDKPETERTAVAEGAVRMSAEAYDLVAKQAIAKGDVLAVAEVAGVMGAKRTGELIPLVPSARPGCRYGRSGSGPGPSRRAGCGHREGDGAHRS